MHLCPVVPQAENVTPLTVKSRSAVGHIIAALFPPNSKSVLPSLFETIGARSFPISVLPVAEIRAILSSSQSCFASSFPPLRIRTIFLCSPATLSHAFFIASAHPFE